MTTRRLAAILAADVAGFSAMMERDEEGTAARIRALRTDVIEPALAKHHGRLVKTAGDGFLAEFASPVEAVRSALAIQDQLAARDLRLRIGINLGDIIIEDDGDVLGDGVNVAARLEHIAEPGGICISDEVHRHTVGKIDQSFEDRGEQQVKNIARPVRVFALTGQRVSPGRPTPLPLPDKPSIAVLPFTNMSGDPERDYFADGLAEDIITALARERSFFVSARNSSFTFRGNAVDVRSVGRELGVRYVLEGSVRKAANRVRITGQLIDAQTGAHLWADRYDGQLEDVFELQDRVTESVVAALHPTLRGAESERASRKHPEQLTAYDFYLRALPHADSISADRLEQALDLLDAALRADPNYAQAHALAGWCYVWQRANFLPQRSDAEEKGRKHIERAVALDAHDPTVLWISAVGAVYLGREHDRGLELSERSVTLNPNSAMGWASRGWVQHFGGVPGPQTLESFQTAKRLSPLDPMSWYFHGGMAQAYASDGRYDEAVYWAERSWRENPSWTAVWRSLAGSYARLGRWGDAHTAAAKILETSPTFTISHWRQMTPLRAGPRRDDFLESLRLAGLPE